MKRFFAVFLALASMLLSGDDLSTASGKVYKDYRIIGVNARGVMISFSNGAATIPLSELPNDLREKYSAEVAKKQATAQKRAVEQQRSAGLKKMILDLEGHVTCVQVLEQGVIASHVEWDNNFRIDDLDTSGLTDDSAISRKGQTLRLYCIGTFSYRAVSGARTTIPYFTVSRPRALKYLEKHPDARVVGMRKAYRGPTAEDMYRKMRQENRIRQQHIRPQLNRQKYR